MDLNLIAYLLFFPAMMGLAIGVAQTCHRHGRPWMLGLFDHNDTLVDAVNNILLMACYLVNLGYIALVVAAWEEVTSMEHLLATLGRHMATIILVLAGLHYQNIAALLIWSHLKHRVRADHDRPRPILKNPMP